MPKKRKKPLPNGKDKPDQFEDIVKKKLEAKRRKGGRKPAKKHPPEKMAKEARNDKKQYEGEPPKAEGEEKEKSKSQARKDNFDGNVSVALRLYESNAKGEYRGERYDPNEDEKKGRGHPRTFKSNQELRDLIVQYFREWEGLRRIVTLTGLILYLDTTRDTLNEYHRGKYDDKQNKYSDTIKKAKLYIENDKLEKGLAGLYSPIPMIFDLKNNHGYSDKIEQIITTPRRVDKKPKTLEEAQRAYQAAIKHDEYYS